MRVLITFLLVCPLLAHSIQVSDSTQEAVRDSPVNKDSTIEEEVSNTTARLENNPNPEQSEMEVQIPENERTNNSIDFGDILAGISAFVAFIALILSIIVFRRTNELANKDYFLTHRPFAWIDNFGSRNAQNVVVPSLNTVMILISNSPAMFDNESFAYYEVDSTLSAAIRSRRHAASCIH